MSAVYCPHCAAFLIVGSQQFQAAFDCPACTRQIPAAVPPLPPEHVEMYLRIVRPLNRDRRAG